MEILKLSHRLIQVGFILNIFTVVNGFSQARPLLQTNAGLARMVTTAHPLEQLYLTNLSGKTISITDGKGVEYFRSPIKPVLPFVAGGALGKHQVWTEDKKGVKKPVFEFHLEASTHIKDNTGYYQEMFNLFHASMEPSKSDGSRVTWNGRTYRYFVPWILDHCHNMKGQKYFYGYGSELVDLLEKSQRKDGMIYSFIEHMPNVDYFKTRDKFSGYTQQIGDKVFVRQPTENHPEYNYVNTIYQCWKSAGDNVWMKNKLASAAKALDYTINDPARWSLRFQLLKRVYTIDSWDFAVEDEYLPKLGLTNSMIIDPNRSKFGVFFGDNTGYISACFELAEMFERCGQSESAKVYQKRGQEIKTRLDKLAWNGRFYTHFIEEDSTIVRNLGVDERSQIAQSNAYSLNRPLDPGQSKAIIETYLDLKNHLPIGSPGEWYAIYPPFQRGFGTHNDIWQYMNGGVGGHVAGELSRGAFASGYESYASGILDRLFALGKKYDNKIYFAYTGSFPPSPPSPVYRSVDLSSFANMDFWIRPDSGTASWMRSKSVGDDFRNLPVGEQTFAKIKFKVIDPAQNQRKAVLAVSKQAGLPATVEIPVNDTAACVYLLHTASKPSSENVVGAVSFVYADGSSKLNYILTEKHLTYWWFSQLKTDYSGIAWYGKNQVSEGVGLSWCALDNPNPEKKISKIILHAPEGNGIYTVFGITFANQTHYLPAKGPSFGGPDNWAAATAMAALIEGLAGVNNAPQTEAFDKPLIAPRWVEGKSDTVEVQIVSPAAGTYVAYQFLHQRSKQQIQMLATGSGRAIQYHVLLPEKIGTVKSVLLNGMKSIPFKISSIEQSVYVDFEVPNIQSQLITIRY